MPRFSDDKALVEQVLGGSDGAWQLFLNRYSNDFLRVGARWCCGGTTGVRCPLKSAPKAALLRLLPRSDCDQVMETYRFLCDMFRNRLLRYYTGDCPLDPWMYLRLYPRRGAVPAGGGNFFTCEHLYAEWRRQGGREGLPQALKHLPEAEKAVFRFLHRGQDYDEIARKTRLSVGDVARIYEKVRDLLSDAGPDVLHYWLGSVALREVSLTTAEEDGGESDWEVPATGQPGVQQQMMARQALEGLRRGLTELSDFDRRVLRLKYDKGMTLSQISAFLERLGVFRTPRQVDADVTHALAQLVRRLREDPELSAIAETDADTKGLKEVLDDYGSHLWTAGEDAGADRPQGQEG